MGEDKYRLGYERVDADPHTAVLLATMDATAAWSATLSLRAWESERLALSGGQRLLDVGCGLGDAGLALASGLGEDGGLVGIDASSEMITAARQRASGMRCRVRFSVGDAHALNERDASFDAVRSERTLQWLPHPEAAVAEMARVTRAGGLVSLIDSDWSTFCVETGDDSISRRVREAMRLPRARPHDVGGRLVELIHICGLELVAETSAIQTWSAWDPDASPAPDGCFSMWSLADDLIETGNLARPDRQEFVEQIHDAARRGEFSMALTMFALVARIPGTPP